MVRVTNRYSAREAGKAALSALILSSTALTPLHSVAAELPTGANVAAGQADIVTNGSQMLVNQGGENAIINWESFSIGGGAGVTFNNGTGATLNRVLGASTSNIDGLLQATGDLYLINQNGIVVGKDGVIETGGKFVASTLDINDADFLDGGDMTFSGNSAASVVNLGKVGSLGGDIAIIARHITNEGELNAENGTVGLAAGREVLMHDTSLDGGMFVVKVGDADSSITEAGIINAATAELRANGGNIYALAGNNGGAINATGVSASGGRIFLTAGNGKVRVAKKIRATRSGNGGSIFLNADEVSIGGLLQADGENGFGGQIDIGGTDISLESATVDASGTQGGGRIRIGGAFQGGDFTGLTTANYILADANTQIKADAISMGDGGEVVVWSNENTDFYGFISAHGENGGSAEVSGKNTLDFAGQVDLGGTSGNDGILLLDPSDFTIDATQATTISNALLTANVVVSTNASGAGNGDIFVNSAITQTTKNDLTLLAHHHIVGNASIQIDGTGDLNLVAGWDGSSGFSGSSGVAANSTVNWAAFNSNSYGNGSGSVFIGDGTHATGLAFGSSGGTTSIMAYGVDLTGSSTANAYSQVGFAGAASGAIDLQLKGDLNLVGGAGTNTHAQIGHGSASGGVSGNIQGNISVVAGGKTSLEANTGGYRIGHKISGSVSSANVALITNGLSVTGGDFATMIRQDLIGGDVLVANTHTQIKDANQSSPDFTDDIIFDGPGYSDSFDTDHSLSFLATGEVTFEKSLQIEGTGNINLVAGWDGTTGLNLSGFPLLNLTDIATNANAYGYSQGDNGDLNIREFNNSNNVHVGTWMGDVNVFAHDLDVAGASNGSSSRLGAYANADVSLSGNINITVADDVVVRGGSGDGASAAIGHAFGDAGGSISGNIKITSANDQNYNEVIVAGGDGKYAAAMIGHESYDGGATGLIKIVGEDVYVGSLRGSHAAGQFASAQIGHIGSPFDSNYSASGNIEIDASGNLIVVGGEAEHTGGLVGHYGINTDGDIKINTMTNGDNVYIGFDDYGYVTQGDQSTAQIGHYAFEDAQGSININALDQFVVVGGDGSASFGQVGHFAINSASGNIIVSSSNEAFVVGGFGAHSGAQMGHRGAASINGNIALTATNDVFIRGDMGTTAAGHVGHYGMYDISGNIDVTAGGIIDLLGGSGSTAAGLIGHYNNGIDPQYIVQGSINAIAGGEFTIEDGTGVDALAWIGHQAPRTTVANADVFVQASAFDRDSNSTVAAGDLGRFNKEIMVGDIPSGNFTLVATGSGLLLQDPAYNSPFQLLVSVNNDLVLGNGATFTNTGSGNIVMAAGGNFHNDTGSLTPLQTAGRWLVYSTRPDTNRNDIEITNWDFLRFSTSFNINDPVPASFSSGNGLIYSVTPVLNLVASDEMINFGQTPNPTVSRSITVNGANVNPADFGLAIVQSNPDFSYAAFVPFVSGVPSPGNYVGGLIPEGQLVISYYGILTNIDAGDLDVSDPTIVVGTPGTNTPTRSKVTFGVCSPSEDDLRIGPYDRNSGQICTLLPTEED